MPRRLEQVFWQQLRRAVMQTREAAWEMTRILPEPIEPNASVHVFYNRLFEEVYQFLFPALQPYLDQLASLSNSNPSI